MAWGTAVGAVLAEVVPPEDELVLAAGAADPVPDSVSELELAAGAAVPELAGAAGCSAGAEELQATASNSVSAKARVKSRGGLLKYCTKGPPNIINDLRGFLQFRPAGESASAPRRALGNWPDGNRKDFNRGHHYIPSVNCKRF